MQATAPGAAGGASGSWPGRHGSQGPSPAGPPQIAAASAPSASAPPRAPAPSSESSTTSRGRLEPRKAEGCAD
eukprot:650116-Pyramimonas_sp.AAC.1